jgi:hypothetical protein
MYALFSSEGELAFDYNFGQAYVLFRSYHALHNRSQMVICAVALVDDFQMLDIKFPGVKYDIPQQPYKNYNIIEANRTKNVPSRVGTVGPQVRRCHGGLKMRLNIIRAVLQKCISLSSV